MNMAFLVDWQKYGFPNAIAFLCMTFTADLGTTNTSLQDTGNSR